VNPLHDYLCARLDEKLAERQVVVFYDPRVEFAPLFDRELQNVGAGPDGLYCVFVRDRQTLVARYDGSFFEVRAAVESTVAEDEPAPLLIYVPGVAREQNDSVLMELEKGGATYEPQLMRHARTLLRQFYTDGAIDDMLEPESLAYDDVVAYLEQAQTGGQGSILKTIFAGASSELLLTQWLTDDSRDGEITTKGALRELLRLIEARLGLVLADGTSIEEARTTTARFVLVNEFRDDYAGGQPSSMSMIASPPAKEQLGRAREVADGLRRGLHADRYAELADEVEKSLNLTGGDVDASGLGATDTFRFEERVLLKRAIDQALEGQYEEAIELASDRKRSYWIDRDVVRQQQWEACRLAAELGREVASLDKAVQSLSGSSSQWVATYADRWFEVDRLQRRLDGWVARMDEDPEADQAIAVVRLRYDELLKRMAAGFADALKESGWTVPGVLSQTSIYPDVVRAAGARVGYFVVDALRYEMGAELVDQLRGAADELSITPAVAMLPTLTPVGMAALLPGGSASFSVGEEKGKLGAQIEQTFMANLNDRLRFLKAKVPDVVELQLERLLRMSSSKLETTIGDASLVLVRSQEIDLAGETGFARYVMETVVSNIARAARKLASAGVEQFVVSADHGHQFASRKEEDMRIDPPGGDTVELHRRCWIGRGGATPAGTIRVSAAELGYDTELDFVFPRGLGVFKAGGDLAYHHGGISLQEMVVPVVTFRIAKAPEPARSGGAVDVQAPDEVTNRLFTVRLLLSVLREEPLPVRIVLLSGAEQVGEAGMAVDADFDREAGVVSLRTGVEASVGVMLLRDDCETVRLVAQDPATDAVLGESGEIPVRLSI
jgi:PglZ domain